MTKWTSALLILSVSVGGFLLGWVIKPAKDSLVVVNLHQAMAKPAELLAKSHYSESQQKTIMKQFSRMLMPVIERYALDHHKTVINAQVFANHSKLEVTDDIVKLTLEAIKHGD